MRTTLPRSAWLLALAPVVATLALIFSAPRPPTQAVVPVSPLWRTAVGTSVDWRAPRLNDASWREVTLPVVDKTLVVRYPVGRQTYRGSFTLNPRQPVGEDLFLVCDCLGTVVVNGEVVGEWDPYRRGPRLGVANGSNAGFRIPARLLYPGGNSLVLEVTSSPQKMLLGGAPTIEPYFVRLLDLKKAVTLGPNFFLLMLAVLFWRLSKLHEDPQWKRIYRAAVLLAVGGAVLADLKLGIFQTMPETNPWTIRWHTAVTVLTTWYFYEFFESYFAPRPLFIRYVNRVATFGCAIACLWINVFNLWSNYAIAMMAWTVYMVVTSPRVRTDYFGPVLASTFLCWLGQQCIFLVLPDGDAWMVLAPDVMLGMSISAVLVADFLKVFSKARELSVSLHQTNTELASALARATEAARVKGEFVATVSHELRTPLNAIINIPSALLGRFKRIESVRCRRCEEEFELEPEDRVDTATLCPGCSAAASLERGEKLVVTGDAEELAAHLKLIQRSGNHLLNVVNDILDFSKLEAGKMVLHAEQVELGEVVMGVVDAMKPLAGAKHIRIEAHIAAEPLELRADRVKLAQLLINLVGNAIKFSGERSVVTLSLTRSDDRAIIDVQDRGIGVTREQMAYIFEPFRQADSGHTRRFGGTGLGLSIAKKIVDLHRGNISVESVPGQSTTFRVMLPIGRSDATPVPQLAPRDKRDLRARPLVVVADDEPVMVETIRLALRAIDVDVLGVLDPREVKTVLQRERPAALILDVVMPRLSGLDVLKELRADAAFEKLPVLVSSAYEENEPLVLALGASWLAKPWTNEGLHERVRELIASWNEARQRRSA